MSNEPKFNDFAWVLGFYAKSGTVLMAYFHLYFADILNEARVKGTYYHGSFEMLSVHC
jgi:hypothetical protein